MHINNFSDVKKEEFSPLSIMLHLNCIRSVDSMHCRYL